MPVALRRITPAVVQSIQVFFRLCCMQVYLFCAVSRLLAAFAAACQPGGDDPDAGADCLSHSSSAMGSSRGALAIGRNVAVFCPCRGGCGELCTTITGGWLAYFAVIALSTVMVLGTTAWVVEKSIAMKCAG